MTYGEPEHDDERPEIQWRHLRTAVTLLVLVGVMVAAAYFGWQRIAGEGEEDDTTAESCVPAADVAVPAPADVEINVYNATNRSGLAADVADLMRERGFVVAEVANDPLGKAIEGTAEIRGNPAQQGAAALLTTTVPESVFVPDDREANTLDVVLGEAFTELAAADTQVSAPTPGATPGGTECAPPTGDPTGTTPDPTDPPATEGA